MLYEKRKREAGMEVQSAREDMAIAVLNMVVRRGTFRWLWANNWRRCRVRYRDIWGKSFLSRGKRQSKSPEVCLLYSRNSKKANMAKTGWMRTGVKFKLVTVGWYCVGCDLAVWQPDWSLWGLLHWVKYGAFEEIGAGKCLNLFNLSSKRSTVAAHWEQSMYSIRAFFTLNGKYI